MHTSETDGGFFVIKGRRFWLVYNFYYGGFDYNGKQLSDL